MTPADLLGTWERLGHVPGGRWLFSRLVARFVPYSGSIGARIERLAPGDVEVSLRDRRAVRNHLGSIHAVALANLAELTSGLAMLGAAGPGVRGIVLSIDVRFHHKARGRVVATSRIALPPVTEAGEHVVEAAVHDGQGVLVATAAVTWRLAPR